MRHYSANVLEANIDFLKRLKKTTCSWWGICREKIDYTIIYIMASDNSTCKDHPLVDD